MKGFLVTQQEAVQNVVTAAERMRGDTAFDQDELQETIETVQERWSELTTKVDEYEVWLESSVQACKEYEASIEYIKNILGNTEGILERTNDGSFQELRAQIEQLQVRKFVIYLQLLAYALLAKYDYNHFDKMIVKA